MMDAPRRRSASRLWIVAALPLLLPASFLTAQDVEAPAAKVIKPPEVILSVEHQKMCLAGVGDTFPNLKLPNGKAPTDPPVALLNQLGERATVVAFWKDDGYMGMSLLRDLELDVIGKFGKRGVKVIAIAVDTPIAPATELAQAFNFEGALLVDENRAGFAQVGSGRLPRVYVLNPAGEIVWFDIEYSLSTRRELKQSLTSLAPKKPKPAAAN